MIKYNLKCHNNHEFESWFSDSNEFEKLDKKKLLLLLNFNCIFPTCNFKQNNIQESEFLKHLQDEHTKEIIDISKKENIDSTKPDSFIDTINSSISAKLEEAGLLLKNINLKQSPLAIG